MAGSFSYWEKKHFFRYDVLIAGSGIVGLNAALTIRAGRPDLSVAILEKGFLPAGASTKNAGFACFGSISELIEQEKALGTMELHALILKRWKGLKKLRSLLGDNALGYQKYGGYELFLPEEATMAHKCADALPHFNAMVADITGEKRVFTEAGHKVGPFGFSKVNFLLENKEEAQLDPGKMMKSLIERAASEGINIYNNCAVNSFENTETGVDVLTNQGGFRCRKLIIATNAFVNALLPEMDVVPGRGQVVVTSPVRDLKFKGTFHYQQGFYYFRNIDGRVLLGGGRNLNFEAERTAEFGETKEVQQVLEIMLKEIVLPQTPFTIDYKWSGIMAFGNELAPIIREVKPAVYCAARCSGMGIAIGSQTGEDIALLALESFNN